jgi:hypothetical protein
MRCTGLNGALQNKESQNLFRESLCRIRGCSGTIFAATGCDRERRSPMSIEPIPGSPPTVPPIPPDLVPPVKEPEPDRLPDEVPLPNPDENDRPVKWK